MLWRSKSDGSVTELALIADGWFDDVCSNGDIGPRAWRMATSGWIYEIRQGGGCPETKCSQVDSKPLRPISGERILEPMYTPLG